MREDCEFRERCGVTGHYFDDERQAHVRCQCLQLELNKQRLGMFYTQSPMSATKLTQYQHTNLLLKGPLESIRKHVARVLLTLADRNRTFTAFDSYRLMDIFLEKDEDYQNYSHFTDTDLAIILLGFGEIKNQRLPDCINQVITRRELLQKPTWVVLGIAESAVATKFNLELFEKLRTFKSIEVR